MEITISHFSKVLGERIPRKSCGSYVRSLSHAAAPTADTFVPIGFIPLSAESLKAISPPFNHEVEDLHHFLSSFQRILCITGAGISTSSGIPDYRGPGGSYTLARHKPITHQEFMGLTAITGSTDTSASSSSSQRNGEMARRRYWARALGGYERLKRARPNDAHYAIHQLITESKIHCLVTQNVDGLHQKCSTDISSGTTTTLEKKIVDLHGRIDRVICMQCNHIYSRDYIQEVIYSMNPVLREIYQMPDKNEIEKRMRPDGDMDLQNLVDYSKVRAIDERSWFELF